MLKPAFYSYFDLINIRQQLREIDPNIHDEVDSLGIYAREFRLPTIVNDAKTALTR